MARKCFFAPNLEQDTLSDRLSSRTLLHSSSLRSDMCTSICHS
jgi:hypothetical protein